MATILWHRAVADGHDAGCTVVVDGGAASRILHWAALPGNLQAAANAAEADLQSSARPAVADVTAEDGTLIHWPPGAPTPPLSRTLSLTGAQSTTLQGYLDSLTNHVVRVADVWDSLPFAQQLLIAQHSPVLRRLAILGARIWDLGD